jgi:non-homologous end joining protein Ku
MVVDIMANKITAYVADFDISLMPINLTGRLVPMRRTGSSKDTALVSICPQCELPTGVDQQYFCQAAEHHGPFKQGELAKAKDINKTLVKVGKDDVKTAKTSTLPLNYLELAVYNAAQVEAATYPGSNAYIFYPKHVNAQYGVMVEVVGNPEFAFIGTVNLKHHETLVRLSRWEDFIVIQQLLYPEDLNETTETPVTYTDEFLATMLQFTEQQLKPFYPTEYKNNIKEQVLALTAAAGEGIAPPLPEKKNDDSAALEQLKAWLDNEKVKV